jgi:hypothetical protein
VKTYTVCQNLRGNYVVGYHRLSADGQIMEWVPLRETSERALALLDAAKRNTGNTNDSPEVN